MNNEKTKKITLNEQQLMQMAQKEEAQLQNKQALNERVSHLLSETITAKEILKEVKKNNGKILVSVGATVLIEAQITDNQNCKRALSDNSYKEDSIQETTKWLEKKEEQIKKQLQSIQTDLIKHQKTLSNYVSILKQIESEKNKAIQKAKQSPPTLSK
ncbi:MAG: hypothetical protein PHY04_02485 [Candidatus ainarchaeum sp.]|jgi:prefoldin subunit 5|nr:hypothetical protein [Candidatus ainarchaeum sp.]MDD3085840.1 hypothetical protein [Candidatus ainarchaeum sp.]MDD4128577.1 hypothetical protein [Candidatus ainarchaeum sp.]HPM85647.1 hypothetical protein [archaeon]